MSALKDVTRRKRILWLALIALGLWLLLALSSLTNPAPSGEHSRLDAPVLSGFDEMRSEAGRIRFTLADENYTLMRSASGWVMEDAGGYPIRPERLAELASGLETLRYDEKRTDDPYKHDLIGLGDPTEGGNGALLEVFGGEGDLEYSLIIGRKADAIYFRAPGDTQTYRAKGDLPPFYNRRAWLEFEIVSIEPAAIRSVRLTDRFGETLYLRRPTGADNRSFVPAPPNETDTLISRLSASTTALAITRLDPVDVKPASDLLTQPIARHISETFDGLEIELRAFEESDGLWVSLRAVEAGEGARRAEVINRKAEGWAFRLTDYDFQDFTLPVSEIVERVR